MPGNIQRVPRGLLGLLDMKTSGQTPPQLGDLVQPQIDLLQMYLLQFPLQNETDSTLNITTPVTYSAIQVPDNVMWFVYGASAEQLSTTVGPTELAVTLELLRQGTNHSRIGIADRFSSTSILDQAVSVLNTTTPILLSAGDGFRGSIMTTPGADTTGVVRVAYREVPI